MHIVTQAPPPPLPISTPHCHLEIGLDGKPFASSVSALDSFCMLAQGTREKLAGSIAIVHRENDERRALYVEACFFGFCIFLEDVQRGAV